MPRRLLVPLDGSPQSWAALEHAIDVHPDAELTALYVIDPVAGAHSVGGGTPIAGEEWYEDTKEQAEEVFGEARELAAEHGVDLETTTEVGRPARTIVEYAEEKDFDGIVMGSHGRSGVSRILLGSVAETVVRRSSVPVTVTR